VTGPGATGASRRTALAVIVGLAGLLTTVTAVVLAGSSDEPEAAAAPAECLDAWNGDEGAMGVGAHVASSHGYTSAWVLYLDETGDEASASDGECAVVFPAAELDPEPEFAVTLNTTDGWLPLYASPRVPASRKHFEGESPVSRARIAELQSDAISATNASVLPDGTLSAP
jgi:hypothetical protein